MRMPLQIVSAAVLAVVVATIVWLARDPSAESVGVAEPHDHARSAAPASAGMQSPPRDGETVREDASPSERGSDSITGTVVDDAGAPIAGAEIVADEAANQRTDRDGRFRLARVADSASRAAIRLVIGPETQEFGNVLVDRWYAWGTHDLRFELARCVPLHVELVDVQGAPVRAEVELREQSPHGIGRRDVERTGAGEVVFPRVAPGRCRLRVTWQPEEFATPRPLAIDIREAARARIVFAPRAELRVVVEYDGVAQRSEVQLVDIGERSVAEAFTTPAGPRYLELESPAGLVDRAWAGSEPAVLHGDPLVPYVVCVVGPHAPVLVEGVRCGGADPLRVRVPGGATVRVRLRPDGVRERMQQLDVLLGLVRTSDGERRYVYGAKDSDTLSASAVAPGEWKLCVVHGPVMHTFAHVALSGTEVVDLEAAMPWLQVAQLRVHVQRDAPRPTVFLQRERPGEGLPARGEWIAVPILSDEKSVAVRAGQYRVRLDYTPQALSTAVFDAAPGANADVEALVPISHVEITVYDRAGEPVPDVRLGLVRDGVMTLEDELPDTDGHGVVRSRCGVGTFEVVALPKQPWDCVIGRCITPQPLVNRIEPRTLLGTITVCEGRTAVASFLLP